MSRCSLLVPFLDSVFFLRRPRRVPRATRGFNWSRCRDVRRQSFDCSCCGGDLPFDVPRGPVVHETLHVPIRDELEEGQGEGRTNMVLIVGNELTKFPKGRNPYVFLCG